MSYIIISSVDSIVERKKTKLGFSHRRFTGSKCQNSVNRNVGLKSMSADNSTWNSWNKARDKQIIQNFYHQMSCQSEWKEKRSGQAMPAAASIYRQGGTVFSFLSQREIPGEQFTVLKMRNCVFKDEILHLLTIKLVQ
jgi:hypothetical protein